MFNIKSNKNYIKNSIINQFKKRFSTTPKISFDLISKNKDIGLLTIKNASKRNALSFEILSGISNELDKIDTNFTQNNTPRVIIINSEGGVFSSGHDLKELNTFSEEQKEKTFHMCSNVMKKIQISKSIIIAEVQGLATAAGCQLAATCDLIVSSSKAKFETPGVRIGLFCSSPSVALGRVISPKRAMHMLVTGEAINATKALEWGLVNEIVDVDQIIDETEARAKLRESTLKLAEHINHFSGEALSFGKKTFYTQMSKVNLEEAYDVAGKAMCQNLGFKDTKEGILAFLQKRKPNFNVK
jgi:enoyl-CoA hydratase/carnithine racemase